MISATNSSVSYTGNNSTVTPYSITFPFVAAAHVAVRVTDSEAVETELVNGSDFDVTPTADSEGRFTGGSLVTDEAVPITSTVLVYRVTPKTQAVDFIATGSLSAEVLESALDKLTMISQEVQRDIDALA